MIFVDTGAWFASFVPSDSDHPAADEWLAKNHRPLLTTDYVFDELVTLLRIRGERKRAALLGEELIYERIASMEKITEGDLQKAWSVFQNFSDKGWSFTDCTSKVVMERLGITQAFAFDEHFRQFGGIAVLP